LRALEPETLDDCGRSGSESLQIKTRFKDGKTIVLMGGGGMGAGTEYLMENGQEFTPHALSTQAGFQFSYEFHGRRGPSE